MSAPLLRLDDLHVSYRSAGEVVDAVRGVTLQVEAGEVVALVGESGSGKSTTAQAIIGLLPQAAQLTAGEIVFQGSPITGLRGRAADQVRGRGIGYVPQDPGVSLNPVHRIGDQIAEVLQISGVPRRRAALDAVEILERVGIDEPQVRARQHPHQISGGMRQRVLIGMAIATRPPLIIADEPTSALDVTVQRAILDLLEDLTRESGSSVLLITHDLAVAGERADRVLVMRAGEIVEQGRADDVLARPEAAYTRELIAAAPSLAVADVPARSTPSASRGAGPLLVMTDVVKDYGTPGRGRRALDGVSLTVQRGTTLALVGESGSGKTTTARIAARLLAPTSGQVRFDGQEVGRLRGEPLRQLRRRVQVVYQNPYGSLDPRLPVERIVEEPLRAFRRGDRRQRREQVMELLDRVALTPSHAGRRPHELSGGQRQRVAIARALALEPDLIVLDEPVSALDVSVQAQILQLLASLQERLGLTYLLISHDLAVVRSVSDSVAVMWQGQIVESGPTGQIFGSPHHEYTRALLDSIPRPGGRAKT